MRRPGPAEASVGLIWSAWKSLGHRQEALESLRGENKPDTEPGWIISQLDTWLSSVCQDIHHHETDPLDSDLHYA